MTVGPAGSGKSTYAKSLQPMYVRILQQDGTQRWLNPEEAEEYAKERGFDFVPILYKGEFNLDLMEKLATGPSDLDPLQQVKEGCVIKSRYNYDIDQNKQALKLINPDYLADRNNTDFH